MRGSTLFCSADMWSTTKIDAPMSAGRTRTSAVNASTPPAEAPMTTISRRATDRT